MSTDRPTVVVGVDGSSESAHAVEWGADFAEKIDADLLLATAWQWPVSYGTPLTWVGFEPDVEAQKIVEQARATVTLPEDRVQTAIREGSPGSVLVELAEESAALVVGSQGHNAIAEAVLGSVSAYCVRRAKCPVVVVR